jgi:hypothetical protein
VTLMNNRMVVLYERLEREIEQGVDNLSLLPAMPQ